MAAASKLINRFLLVTAGGLAGCGTLPDSKPEQDRALFVRTIETQLGNPHISAEEKTTTAAMAYRYLKTEGLDPAAKKALEEAIANAGLTMAAGKAMKSFDTYLQSIDLNKSLDGASARAAFVAQVQGLVDVSYADAGVAAELGRQLRLKRVEAEQAAESAKRQIYGTADATVRARHEKDITKYALMAWANGKVANVLGAAVAHSRLNAGARPTVSMGADLEFILRITAPAPTAAASAASGLAPK